MAGRCHRSALSRGLGTFAGQARWREAGPDPGRGWNKTAGGRRTTLRAPAATWLPPMEGKAQDIVTQFAPGRIKADRRECGSGPVTWDQCAVRYSRHTARWEFDAITHPFIECN